LDIGRKLRGWRKGLAIGGVVMAGDNHGVVDCLNAVIVLLGDTCARGYIRLLPRQEAPRSRTAASRNGRAAGD
jgi:hypothetical protein